MRASQSSPGPEDPTAELRRGDHIRVDRGIYHHDGIYLGNGQVIHLASCGSGKSGAQVQVGDFRQFASGGRVTVRLYNGERDPEQTIARAESRLGDGRYHLVLNNCQHFARWCVTGNNASEQVEIGAAIIGSAAVPMAAGHSGVSWAVSSAGRVQGLSGPGIMSGIADVGSLIGGGAVEGLTLLTAVSGLAVFALLSATALRNDDDLPDNELRVRAVGRAGGAIGGAAGTAAAILAVRHLGVPGFSGPGITSGLSAVGSLTGGGMARGAFCVIAASAVGVALGAYLGYAVAAARQQSIAAGGDDGIGDTLSGASA